MKLAFLEPEIIERLHHLPEQLPDLCKEWKIDELSIFGSVLRDDFTSESDVDFLVTFSVDAKWTLFDVMDFQRELETLVARPIDLAEKSELSNPYRRASILESAQIIYAA